MHYTHNYRCAPDLQMKCLTFKESEDNDACRLASWWRSKGKVLKTSQWEGDPCKREADFEEECEKVFMQTYSFLNKVQDQLTPVSLLKSD